jgi:hypothetical protein
VERTTPNAIESRQRIRTGGDAHGDHKRH